MPSSQFNDLIRLMGSRRLNEKLGIGLLRRGFERVSALFNDPGDAEYSEVNARGVACDWIVPANAREGAMVLYLHGGGYIMGSRNTHRGLAARVARAAGMQALLPEYRLAPDHPFPAALDDAIEAYRWLLDEGLDPAQLAIAGDSAGGGLTIALLMKLRDMKLPLPACGACLSPWTDLAATGESVDTQAGADPMLSHTLLVKAAEAYLNGAPPDDPYASPYCGDFAGLPPLLIHVGGREVLLSDATRAADKARAAGVDVTLDVWDEMTHVWHYFAAMVPESEEAIAQVGVFLGEWT